MTHRWIDTLVWLGLLSLAVSFVVGSAYFAVEVIRLDHLYVEARQETTIVHVPTYWSDLPPQHVGVAFGEGQYRMNIHLDGGHTTILGSKAGTLIMPVSDTQESILTVSEEAAPSSTITISTVTFVGDGRPVVEFK